MLAFKIFALKNPEIYILALNIPEFKISADFKILAFENPEFNILADYKDFSFPKFWIQDFGKF